MPIMAIYVSQSIFYVDKIGNRIKNCAIIYIGYFLTNLIFVLWFIFVYYVVLRITNLAICLLLEIFVFMVLSPILLLVFHLYMVSIFDKFVNKKSYPEIYRKGLSKEEKNE